jgi:hypothetical protein
MSDLTSSEKISAAAERAATRAKFKEAYQRMYNNPFRTNNAVFDPAVFRYEAARAYSKEFYKYTPRSVLIPLGLFTAVVLLQMRINRQIDEKETKIRSGELTYYERAKFASKGLY